MNDDRRLLIERGVSLISDSHPVIPNHQSSIINLQFR